MLTYLKCLLYVSAIAAHSIDMDSEYLDLKVDEQSRRTTNYQIIKENNEKVELQVYYESLCPGCAQFHIHPLDDTYKKIGSYIDLKTYPYGNAMKAEENGKDIIICQHGPEECYGNKLHACAIDILKNVSQSEFYNSCMMSRQWGGKGSTDMDATKCGEKMQIDSKPIIDCAKSQRGEDLLEYYGTETDKVHGRKYVPWVLLNGQVFDVQNSDLMKEVCSKLSSPPPACKQ